MTEPEQPSPEAYFDLSRPLPQATTGESLPGIAPDARQQLKARAKDVLKVIQPWADGYSVVSSKRVLAACLAGCVTFPDGEDWLLALIARFYLGLWALDDVIDGVVGTESSVEQRNAVLQILVHITETAGAGPRSAPVWLAELQPVSDSDPWFQAATIHVGLCETLRGLPGAEAYYPAFAGRFVTMLRSWEVEEQWKRDFQAEGRLPAYAAYVANGRESVIHAAILLALLVIRPDPAMTPWSALATPVEAVLIPASTCIRLANDLRSYPRDIAEGKPTCLQLIMHETGVDEAEAERVLLAEIDDQRTALDAAVALLPPSLATWGATTLRITGFGVEFYLRREFHQFTGDDLSAMAGPG